MDGDQLSPFHLSHDPVTTPAPSAVKKPMVSCSNNPDKPIIKQEIDWTYFLEPGDESGRLALIISQIGER